MASEPEPEVEADPAPEFEPEPQSALEPVLESESEAESAPEPAATAGSAAAAPTAVVVEWPAEEASRVIAVRLVCGAEKFSGRAVRMALAAEGFALGKYSIFHKPAPDGRALL